MTKGFLRFAVAASLLAAGSVARASEGARAPMLPAVAQYVAQREAESNQIPAERVAQLRPLADFVAAKAASGEPARLTFICTHNSRRSHLAQLWAAVAAHRYGVVYVETYSGGTEGTAFNPRAVAALERAGLEIEATGSSETTNPRYTVSFVTGVEPQTCFSKRYDESPNPTSGFAAVMVCTDADEACPTVSGAEARFAIPYEDPKVSDDTLEEAATYDARCAQIARELLLVFKMASEAR